MQEEEVKKKSKFWMVFDRLGTNLSKSIGIGVTPKEKMERLEGQVEIEKRKTALAMLKAKTREANSKFKSEAGAFGLQPVTEEVKGMIKNL